MTDITLNHLTKIEGHAHLTLKIENGVVKQCDLGSIEGSRYFEGMLKGRHFYEANEITSRICGICSCAHVLAATSAVEKGLGVHVSPQTMELRKLLNLGERIRSHATHLYFLALPDYLGYESALSMLPKYKKEVGMALKMMKAGNEIVRIVGGRDLHPVTVTIGGMLKAPKQEEMAHMAESLSGIMDEAKATVKLFSGLPRPKFRSTALWFSLKDPHEYAMLSGTLLGSDGTAFTQEELSTYLSEYHENYSTANFVVKEGKSYSVGSLARLNNNSKQLEPEAQKLLKETGLELPSYNILLNNLAQAIELVHSIEHAIRICKELKVREEGPVSYSVHAGHGIAAIEVPRGILWHEYEWDENGVITRANIITPTAQNLRSMQDDIRTYLPSVLNLEKEKIVLEIEKLIRCYDPCFSCSTHFLEVEWK
jgi:sulfhydrogenase subunit alpha